MVHASARRPSVRAAAARAGIAPRAGARERRAPRADGRQRQRARVRHALRTPCAAPVSLLPLDRRQRHRRAGRAAVGVDLCARSAACRQARRAFASLVVSDHAQRGGLADSPSPSDARALRGGTPGRTVRRGPGAGAGSSGAADARPPRAWRPPARRPADARAERPLTRGDRARLGSLFGRRQAGDLRGSPGPARPRGGSRHAL